MKATPLQQVKEQFGGREALVDAIMPLLDGASGETKARLLGTTNKKLLRIYETAKIAKEQHGGRKGLIEKIVKARYPQGNPDDSYVKDLEESSVKKLLELHRQASAD